MRTDRCTRAGSPEDRLVFDMQTAAIELLMSNAGAPFDGSGTSMPSPCCPCAARVTCVDMSCAGLAVSLARTLVLAPSWITSLIVS